MVGKALWPSWRRKCLIKNSHISFYISITKAFIANQSCFWLLAGRLLLGKMIIFGNLRPSFFIRWQSKNSPLSRVLFDQFLPQWVSWSCAGHNSLMVWMMNDCTWRLLVKLVVNRGNQLWGPWRWASTHSTSAAVRLKSGKVLWRFITYTNKNILWIFWHTYQENK